MGGFGLKRNTGIRRGSIRTQLILWNAVALALIMGLMGALVRITVASTLMASVDSQLEMRTRVPRFPGRPPGTPLWPPGQHNDGGHGFGDHNPDDPGPPMDPGMMGPGGGPGGDGMAPPPREGGPPGMGGPDGGGGPGGGGGPRDGGGPGSPPHPPRNPDPYRPRRLGMDGKPAGPDPNATVLDPAGFQHAKAGDVMVETIDINGEPVRVRSEPVPHGPHPAVIMQAGYPLTDTQRAISDLTRVLLMLIPLALLFAGLGGSLLTNRMLRRVRYVTQAASQIGSERLTERLPIIGNDEFAHLAETFNGMLDRIQAAFEAQQRLIAQQRRFTADASHELKTPLTVIRGTAGLMRMSPALDEEAKDAFCEIDRAAGSMSTLVQDLLLLARADADQLGRSRIDLLISDVLEQAQSAIHKADRPAMAVKREDPSLVVHGNEQELVRVFTNLLDNATRYTPQEGCVRVIARRQGDWAVIDVTDTGPGIAAEHLAHLGERFYRVDSARARQDGGSGLGLSICRSIVEAHGGSIAFESAVGRGTTVRVTLPAAG